MSRQASHEAARIQAAATPAARSALRSAPMSGETRTRLSATAAISAPAIAAARRLRQHHQTTKAVPSTVLACCRT